MEERYNSLLCLPPTTLVLHTYNNNIISQYFLPKSVLSYMYVYTIIFREHQGVYPETPLGNLFPARPLPVFQYCMRRAGGMGDRLTSDFASKQASVSPYMYPVCHTLTLSLACLNKECLVCITDYKE